MNNPLEYTNHTGGAPGADTFWDGIGRSYGVENHNHYTFEDVKALSTEDTARMLTAVTDASIALGRPSEFKGIEYIHRDWIQADRSEAIFAVSRIIEPREKDLKGFINNCDKQIVMGGTGWTVEMGIQMFKPAYVFDMNTNLWYLWNYTAIKFVPCAVPVLTKNFAGIGSRFMTAYGTRAINNVYEKTFK